MTRPVEDFMPARRNGNGERSDVPRWVRVLFDQHEVRMAALDRAHEEHVENMKRSKAEHEARMARLEKEDRRRAEQAEESRRQIRAMILELSGVDGERKAETAACKAETAALKAEAARNLAEHKAIMAALDAIRRGVPPPKSP